MGLTVLGRYDILGKLTQGGMAEVYLARQLGPANYQKLVVIKRVRPHLATDKDFVAMFVNEARLAALINHPNVVSIFDLGNEGDNWYLAMEYLDGRDMLQIGRACRQHNKAVPFDVTARIVADACAGLDHAHRLCGSDGKHLNLVHRDMSPENILITFDGSVKVLDFGIAKARDNQLRTQAGQIKGKLGYVAPEAIKGETLDARADIFAIGATLYLFLCGRPAFSGNNPMEVFEKSLQPPVPPSKLNPMVPKALEAICMKCLEQNPQKRFKTAGDLRTALESHLATARRPLGPQQLAHFMRILFPADTDPVRKRTEQLIENAPPPDEAALDEDAGPATAATEALATQQAPPSSEHEATAIVTEQELRSARAPATVDLPSTPRAGYHLRSVSLPDQVPEATMTEARAPQAAAPFATSESGGESSSDSEKTLVGLAPSQVADDIDIDTDEGASSGSMTALPPSGSGSEEADLNPDAFLGDLGGMTAESEALFSDSDGPDLPPPPVGDDPPFPPLGDNDLAPPAGPPGLVPMTDASIPQPTFPVAAEHVPAPFGRRAMAFGVGLVVGTGIITGGLFAMGDLMPAIAYLRSLIGA